MQVFFAIGSEMNFFTLLSRHPTEHLWACKWLGTLSFSDSIWTPQEHDKMHQNSAIRPKIEGSWMNWAQNLDRAFSYSSFLEWNDKKCHFYKISTFSYFNIDLWRHFWTQVCKTGYHSKARGIGNAMKVAANRLLNYTGHGGPKTELRGQKSKIVSENRKSIFRSKLLTAHFGYDRTQWTRKIRSLSRNRKFSIFCCIVIIKQERLFKNERCTPQKRKLNPRTCRGGVQMMHPRKFF